MNTIVENAISYTRQFVQIPSESSDPLATDKRSPEAGVVNLLKKICTEHKLLWSLQEALPGRQNFIVRLPKKDAPKLLIAAHMDTVSARGMNDPFSANLKDNKIYGRGSCDDKGPLAAALSTLCGLSKQKAKLQYDVTLLGTVDEECSLAGAAYFARDNEKFDLCIVLEPTELKLINAHKGVFRCQIISRGKAAHSSTPKLGQNAIMTMHSIISDLQQFSKDLKKIPDPDLGEATLAITKINGGSVVNIIPDLCTISIDIRMLPHHEPKQISKDISVLLAKRGSVRKIFSANAFHSPLTEKHITHFMDALEAEKYSTTPGTAAYATDGSKLVKLGPCIVWGPGSINQAHKIDEYIKTDQLAGACKILGNFLTRKKY